MIFWIEDNIEIDYDTLLEDLKNRNHKHKLTGYDYFRNLIKDLIKNRKFLEVDSLLNFLKNNASRLGFKINTSGTTSRPKKVHVNLQNCIRQVKKNNSESKIWGMCYPVESFASTQVFFQALFNKETIVNCFSKNFKYVNEIIIKYQVTNLTCTPTFLNMLVLNSTKKNHYLKTITIGGEKLSKILLDSYQTIFPNAKLVNIYASTETGSILYSNSDSFKIPDKYRELIKIKNNELIVNESLTNYSNQNRIRDGWFYTGDKVKFLDQDKNFKFLERKSSYINSGGYRISPTDIEDKIISINGVYDARVYGKPNSVLGTIICSEVITKTLSIKQIKEKLKDRLEKFRIPQIIEIVDEIKLTKSGKKSRIS